MSYLPDGVRLLTLCIGILLTGCSSLAEKKTPYEPSQDKFADLAQAATRLEASRTEAQSNAGAVSEYLDAGVSLSNVACEIWFTGLARTERDTTLTKDLMNVVGNFILGVAGINGASPTSLGRGALGLSAANTAFEVYRADVLLGSIEDLRTKIRDDRKVAEDALLARTDITYDAAMRRLLEYHHLCSVERIKVLLSTSLANVKFERPDTTLATPIDKAKATALVTTLKAQIGNVDALLQDQDLLYQAYLALVVYPTEDDSNPEVAKNARKNQVVALYMARYAALSTASSKEEVLTTFQQIAVLLKFGDRLKADLAAGAAQKEFEAKRSLDDANTKLNARLKSLSADMGVKRALSGTGAVTTPDQFVAEVRNYDVERVKRQLNTLLSNRADLQGLVHEMQTVQDAQARLKLAAASADRARAAAAPLGGVTPRIVPVGQ
jgi:hypothetical protein